MLGNVPMLLRVQFNQFPLTLIFRGQIFNHRTQYFTGTAPFCPEIHQHRDMVTLLDNIGVKVGNFVTHFNSFSSGLFTF